MRPAPQTHEEPDASPLVSRRKNGAAAGYPTSQIHPIDDRCPFGSPGFFQAADMAMAGRDFLPSDHLAGPEVVIADEAVAQKHFGKQQGLGRRVADRRPAGAAPELVGIVGDSRSANVRMLPEPTVFQPLYQFERYSASAGSLALHVHAHRSGGALIPAIERQILH